MLALKDIDFLWLMGPFHVLCNTQGEGQKLQIILTAQAFLMPERGIFGRLGLPCRPRSSRTTWIPPEAAISLFFPTPYSLN